MSSFLSAKTGVILELKPDLVLGFSDLQADIGRDLAKAGLNVMLFNQRSVDEILGVIRMLAAIVGVPEKGAALVRKLEDNLDAIRAAARGFPRKPKVYFEEWDEPMISAIRWVSELVEIAGGEDIFRDLSFSQAAAGRIVHDPLRVVEKSPEIIFGSWCGKKYRPERVAARPGWDQIPAVQGKHLYEIKSAEILQPGPAALTDGVRRIHAVLEGFFSRR